MNKLYYLSFIFFTLFFSCNSDDDSSLDESPLLVKYEIDYGFTIDFIYNDNRKIEEEIWTENGEVTRNFLYSYPIGKTVIDHYLRGEYIDSRSFEKISDAEILRDDYNKETQETNYFYYYTLNDCGVTKLKTLNPRNQSSSENEYAFNDSCTSRERYIDGQLRERITFDGLNSQFHQLRRFQHTGYPNPGNITSFEVFHSNGELTDWSYNCVYEYNSDNYPIKQTRTHQNGRTYIATFTYE